MISLGKLPQPALVRHVHALTLRTLADRIVAGPADQSGCADTERMPRVPLPPWSRFLVIPECPDRPGRGHTFRARTTECLPGASGCEDPSVGVASGVRWNSSTVQTPLGCHITRKKIVDQDCPVRREVVTLRHIGDTRTAEFGACYGAARSVRFASLTRCARPADMSRANGAMV